MAMKQRSRKEMKSDVDAMLPEYVTPQEAMLMFEAGRDVALDGILREFPGFDLSALQTEDSERYWQIVDTAVQISKLTQPVRREIVHGIVENFVTLLYSAAKNQEEKNNDRRLH